MCLTLSTNHILKKQQYDEFNRITSVDKKGNPLYKNEIMELMKNKDGKTKSSMLEFAAFTQKEVENIGMDALKEELQFNEEDALKNNIDTIKTLSGAGNIEIIEYNESLRPKGAKEPAMPGRPLIVLV